MEEKNNLKACVNCRYFLQYYIKSGTHLTSVNCGHCNNLHVVSKDRPKAPLFKCCNKWETAEINKTERKENTKKYIKAICGYLEELVLLLKDDKN